MQDTPTSQLIRTDVLDPARAGALAATLGIDATFAEGTPLPPFFHQIYFWDARRPEALGRDGHPAVGDDLIPDFGLPRRMWAGGALEFLAPLCAGRLAEKRSACIHTSRKTGRSGPLGFVTLQHEIWQDGTLCVREAQDLVYRADAAPGEKGPLPPRAPEDATAIAGVRFDPTLLFRYSALTFNGHRIHYDPVYAREVEGYDGLVVHGPLLAQKLILWAGETAPVSTFRFRGTSALMVHETAELCRDGARMWVRGPDGRQVMTAEVNAGQPV